MTQTNVPTFGRFDLLYAQLYSWIRADPSERKDVTNTIIKRCTEKRTDLEGVVDGTFAGSKFIEDRGAYINFSNLSFAIDVEDHGKIDCIARIRINPCIKLPLISVEAESEEKYLNENMISDRLKNEFRDKKIPLAECPTVSKMKENGFMWEIDGGEAMYLVQKGNGVLEIFNKATPPFFSKIWVIINTISKVSVEDGIFGSINEIARRLCDATAKPYLSILGGAQLEACIHDIKIKSMATDDERLLNLMFGEDSLNDLLTELEESEYSNKILDSIFTNLCESSITDWKKHLSDECVKNADWKLVKSGKTKGLYAARQKDDSTIISTVFYSPDRSNNYNLVNNILHGWAVDLTTVL